MDGNRAGTSGSVCVRRDDRPLAEKGEGRGESMTHTEPSLPPDPDGYSATATELLQRCTNRYGYSGDGLNISHLTLRW